jgi:hypothetical protein
MELYGAILLGVGMIILVRMVVVVDHARQHLANIVCGFAIDLRE